MKLLTKEIKKDLPALGSTDGNDPYGDTPVAIKFFTPDANWTWYITEGSPYVDEDGKPFYFVIKGNQAEYFQGREMFDACKQMGMKPQEEYRFFGLCCGFESELGYVHLSQLAEIRGNFGLPVERNRNFNKPLRDVPECPSWMKEKSDE